MLLLDSKVEEEWSPGEIVVDRSAINTFGSRSEPRQSGSTTLFLSLDKALGFISGSQAPLGNPLSSKLLGGIYRVGSIGCQPSRSEQVQRSSGLQ